MLHRTICAGLIEHVIAPHLKKELIDDLKVEHFPLIIDESTDNSIEKHLRSMVNLVGNNNY